MSPSQRQAMEHQNDEKAYRASTNWYWRIVYGVFNDDICFTNQSGYELHNISLDVNLSVNGNNQNLHLILPNLENGFTYKWPNVLKVSKGSVDKKISTAVMTADETRGPSPSHVITSFLGD